MFDLQVPIGWLFLMILMAAGLFGHARAALTDPSVNLYAGRGMTVFGEECCG